MVAIFVGLCYHPCMFIRIKSTPNSPRKSVQIVASVRDGNKVRQKIMRHVGVAQNDAELAQLRNLSLSPPKLCNNKHTPKKQSLAMKQTTFASIAYTHKKVTTKREAFLNEMERVVPWSQLLKLIEPYYPKAGNGRPPMPMETMLRIYFLQQWYSLSDPAAEEALYDT